MDAGFHSPVLTGDGFFAQFRPDRLIYDIRGQYERKISAGLFISWYAAYRVNMPADKAVFFTGALGTGLSIKNQPDFERLDRGFRFESSAGWNFKHGGELLIRVGVNTIPEKGLKMGSDLTFLMIGRRRDEIDWRLFIDTGGTVSARPFVGLRNEPALGGDHRWTGSPWWLGSSSPSGSSGGAGRFQNGWSDRPIRFPGRRPSNRAVFSSGRGLFRRAPFFDSRSEPAGTASS